MRLFIGIPLAAACAEELKRAAARLRAHEDGLRWSAPESWHVTLQFLGECSEEQRQCVVARLAEVRGAAATIQLGGFGVFERAGNFHVAVGSTPELLALQKKVVAATARCGFVAEAQPYSPHITLAREKRRSGGLRKLKSAMAPKFTAFAAREFLLYESFLGPGGSKYEVRARFGLGEEG